MESEEIKEQLLRKAKNDMNFLGTIFLFIAIFLAFGAIWPLVLALKRNMVINLSPKMMITLILSAAMITDSIFISWGCYKLKRSIRKIVFGSYILFVTWAILHNFFLFNLPYLIFGIQLNLFFRLLVALLYIFGYPYAVILPFIKHSGITLEELRSHNTSI